MSFTWSFKAYARDLMNPPSMQSSCDIDLRLVNAVGTFQLIKENVVGQTEYRVSVLNPPNLGVPSFEQGIINTASQDLILACSLVLQRTVLSVFKLEPNKPDVLLAPIPTEVTVKDIPTGKSIEIRETLRIRDEVHVAVGTKEDMDEPLVQRVASQLNRLQRFKLDASSGLLKANLTNALHEYEAAMASLDSLLLFKHFYNAHEIISNIDGRDRNGSDLDLQMATITGASQTDCKNWRDLYNRTKHIHRNLADVSTFVSGTDHVTSYNSVMRPAAGKELVRILGSV